MFEYCAEGGILCSTVGECGTLFVISTDSVKVMELCVCDIVCTK